MNIMYYSIAGAIAFLGILAALIVTAKKLKTAKMDSSDKAAQLARYVVIINAEDEAARIVTQAKTEAATTISVSETDAKFITDLANAVLEDARTAAEKLSNETQQTVDLQLAKKSKLKNRSKSCALLTPVRKSLMTNWSLRFLSIKKIWILQKWASTRRISISIRLNCSRHLSAAIGSSRKICFATRPHLGPSIAPPNGR